jgi:hypothetical protein
MRHHFYGCMPLDLVVENENNNQNSTIYLRAFLVCLSIMSLRGWMRLAYPEFWAEDSTIYFTEALRDGFSVMFVPRFGTYHVGQRLIAGLIVTFMPVGSWAFWNTLICYIIAAACAATIVCPGFRWLIPSVGARIAVAVMLCMVPGLNEMLGNLCNLNWLVLLWFALLGLRDPSQKVSIAELAAAFVVTFSLGTAVLLAPLFAWRLLNCYRKSELKSHRSRAWVLCLLCSVSPLWLAYLNHNGIDGYPTFVIQDIYSQGPGILVEHLARLLMMAPWLGMGLQNTIWNLGVGAWIVPILMSVGVVRLVFKNQRESILAVGLYLGGIAVWPVLNWIGRPGALPHFIDDVTSGGARYAYPLSSAAIFFWMAVIRPETLLGRNRSWICIFFIVSNLVAQRTDRGFTLGPRRRPAPMEKTTYWGEGAPALQASLRTGCPRKVFIQSSTPGAGLRWGVSYQAPVEVPCAVPTWVTKSENHH